LTVDEDEGSLGQEVGTDDPSDLDKDQKNTKRQRRRKETYSDAITGRAVAWMRENVESASSISLEVARWRRERERERERGEKIELTTIVWSRAMRKTESNCRRAKEGKAREKVGQKEERRQNSQPTTLHFAVAEERMSPLPRPRPS